MIRRACPKFLTAEMIAVAGSVRDCETGPDELYFNRGSSGLKFLLGCIRTRLQRAPLIAMQSFNCITVLDAALEAGCDVTLCDIKLDDFSMSLESLAAGSGKPDVVLLLHYQGLRNSQHDQIADFCRSNGIILVEDLAHSTGTDFPLLGQFGIFSFAFDKPFTCMAGGQLVCGEADADICDLVKDRYAQLPIETSDLAVKHINRLEFNLRVSKACHYVGSDLSESSFELLQSLGVPDGIIEFAADKRLLVGGLNAIARVLRSDRHGFGADGCYAPLRLRPEKIGLITMQRLEHERRGEEFAALGREAAALIRDATGLPTRQAEWNRLSVLEPSGRLAGALRHAGVQAGNYNWSAALHTAPRGIRVGVSTECCRSEHAARNVVNIPVWSPEVLPMIRRVVQDWGRA